MVSASVFRSDEWYLRNTLTIRPQPEANRYRLRKHLVENYLWPSSHMRSEPRIRSKGGSASAIASASPQYSCRRCARPGTCSGGGPPSPGASSDDVCQSADARGCVGEGAKRGVSGCKDSMERREGRAVVDEAIAPEVGDQVRPGHEEHLVRQRHLSSA